MNLKGFKIPRSQIKGRCNQSDKNLNTAIAPITTKTKSRGGNELSTELINCIADVLVDIMNTESSISELSSTDEEQNQMNTIRAPPCMKQDRFKYFNS